MESVREIESPRILWVAALTIFVSVVLVLVVREAAVRVLHPSPTFAPLTVGWPAIDTVIAVTVAILVFIKISTYRNPVALWRSVATASLLRSFLPDVSLARSQEMGCTWPEAYALMTMHIVAWAVCITLLPALAFTKGPSTHRSESSTSILDPPAR